MKYMKYIRYNFYNSCKTHIYRIYYEEGGVEANSVQLKVHIISLKQDKAIRASLEPSFGVFLKTPRLHPGNIIQNCILSLL